MADYEAVVVGDFNGDLRDDIVALPRSNSAEFFMQMDGGVLAPPIIFRYGSENYRSNNLLLKDDFNNDHLPDVAFHTVDRNGAFGGVGLLLSRTQETPVFHQGYPELNFASGESIGDWASIDVDGDGNKDIVVLRGTDDYITYPECFQGCPNIQTLKGDGRGSFLKGDKIFLPFKVVRGLVTEDIDGDGIQDLVLSADDSVSPPYGTGVYSMKRLATGGLSNPVLLHRLAEHDHLSFADLNGDGRIDSIAGYEVHFRTATGDFGPPLGLAGWYPYPSTAFVADIDGNGQADVINHQFSDFGTYPFLAVYLQQDGVIQSPLLIQDAPLRYMFKVSYHKRAYAAGDVNGDGCQDMVIAGGYDGVILLHGKHCVPKPPRPTGGNLPPRLRQ